MANRRLEKSRARVREAVAGELEPGEEIEVLLFAVTRPSLGFDALLSPFGQRTWYVALTDRRVFLVGLNRSATRPTGILWIEPRAGVSVDRYDRGKLLGKLFLRRLSDQEVVKLRFNSRNRAEALALKTALGA